MKPNTYLLKRTPEERDITKKAAKASGLTEAQLIRAAIRLVNRNPEKWYKEAKKG